MQWNLLFYSNRYIIFYGQIKPFLSLYANFVLLSDVYIITIGGQIIMNEIGCMRLYMRSSIILHYACGILSVLINRKHAEIVHLGLVQQILVFSV